ncbi:hypothetical protein PL11201_440011 [Planktothrix sp. PCC 11201]|nr:hypothetical protein PL11201_440011 [Planktothrix sp. PCC 11201]
MDINAALDFISSQLMAKKLKTLSTLETTILKEAWKGKDGKSYDEIGNSEYLDGGSVKTAAYKLWQRLSNLCGEKVNRDNVQAVVERYYNKIGLAEATVPINSSLTVNIETIDSEDHRECHQIEITLREKTNWEQKKLFGINTILEQLRDHLQTRDDYWLMSITGAGGIGKTSLTEKLVGEYAADAGFFKLAWTMAKRTYYLEPNMSVKKDNNKKDINTDYMIYDIASQLDINLPPANQDYFLALQRKLTSEPYLIVIDNLETLPEYQKLLARFNPFDPMCNIRPSKVIFTSRKDLKANNCAVREIKLPGIDKSATLEMIRHQGQELDIVKQALDEELEPIYQKTEGNPLMISLVMNLLRIYDDPLLKIFERFEQDQDIQEFLYEESLNSLSDNALLILNLMIKYAAGYLIPSSDLQKPSGLNNDEFRQAITECSQFNLLDSSRSLKDESRYSIHSLLYEFLRRIQDEH